MLIDLGDGWGKSSYSNSQGGACVAARAEGDNVQVAHSRHLDGTVAFTRAEWAAFLAGVKAGEFDHLA